AGLVAGFVVLARLGYFAETAGPLVGPLLMLLALPATAFVFMEISMSLRPLRHVTVYRDESRAEIVLRVLQDQRVAFLTRTYTVLASGGEPIATLRKTSIPNLVRWRSGSCWTRASGDDRDARAAAPDHAGHAALAPCRLRAADAPGAAGHARDHRRARRGLHGGGGRRRPRVTPRDRGGGRARPRRRGRGRVLASAERHVPARQRGSPRRQRDRALHPGHGLRARV